MKEWKGGYIIEEKEINIAGMDPEELKQLKEDEVHHRIASFMEIAEEIFHDFVSILRDLKESKK